MNKLIKKLGQALSLCMVLGLAVILGVQAEGSSASAQPVAASTEQDKVADMQTAQSDVARVEAEIAAATQAAETLKTQAEDAMKKVLELEQTGKIASPEYAQASAEAGRLRSEYEDARLKITKLVAEKASVIAQSQGVKLSLIDQMRARIAAKVEELKAEAAKHLAKAEMAPVETLAAQVAATIPAGQAISSPVAVPFSDDLSPETLRLKAQAQQAQADAAAAAQRAQEAEDQMNKLTAEYEKTKQDIAQAQAKEAALEQATAAQKAKADAAAAAAKQAELQVAAAPAVAPVVTAINMPQGFEVDGSGFTEVTVGAYNGNLEIWAIKDGSLSRWNAQAPAGSRMQSVSAVDTSGQVLTGFTSVSIAADGTLLALQGGKAYRFDWSKNQFALESAGAAQAGITLDRIAVGSSVNIWAVDSKNQKIYQLTQQGWQSQFDGTAVAAGADNTVLALNAQGVAFRRVMRKATATATKRKKTKNAHKKGAGKKVKQKNAGADSKVSWQAVDPKNRQKLDDVAVVNKDLALGITQGTKELVQLVGKREQWIAAQAADGKAATGFVRIAANAASTMVAIDANGTLSRRGNLAVAPQAAALAKQKKLAKGRAGKKAKQAKKAGKAKGAAGKKKTGKKGAGRKGTVKSAAHKKQSGQRAKAGAGKKSAGKKGTGQARKASTKRGGAQTKKAKKKANKKS